MALKNIVDKAYDGIEPKPLIISPGGFFDAKWIKEFINKTTGILDVVTHHIYNLGAGMVCNTIEISWFIYKKILKFGFVSNRS